MLLVVACCRLFTDINLLIVAVGCSLLSIVDSCLKLFVNCLLVLSVGVVCWMLSCCYILECFTLFLTLDAILFSRFCLFTLVAILVSLPNLWIPGVGPLHSDNNRVLGVGDHPANNVGVPGDLLELPFHHFFFDWQSPPHTCHICTICSPWSETAGSSRTPRCSSGEQAWVERNQEHGVKSYYTQKEI